MLLYRAALDLSPSADLIRRHRHQVGSRWRRLSPGSQALLVLVHLRSVATMMRHLHGDRLPNWISAVRDDDLPHLRQFADGLTHDLNAVTAGLTLPWSSGQAEGPNTRVKLLKRAGYGRSNFDLRRKRILLRT